MKTIITYRNYVDVGRRKMVENEDRFAIVFIDVDTVEEADSMAESELSKKLNKPMNSFKVLSIENVGKSAY
jgi:hypothetical protein